MMKTAHILGVLMAGAMALPAPASAAFGFGSNLIANGDAEADTGSDTGDAIGPVTGFTDLTGTFTVVTYGASGGFPAVSDIGPVGRGLNFFAGGPSAASSSGSQRIDVSAGASAIDTGLATYAASGYFGGFSSQRDHAFLSLSFLGAAQDVLGTASIGGVTPDDRSNATGLLFREGDGTVPIGTRAIDVTLQLDRFDGAYNDGYADKLSVVLSPVPEPTSLALFSAGLLALGGGALRQRLRKD